MLYDAIKSKQIIARKLSHEAKPRLPKKVIARSRTSSEVREKLESVGLKTDGIMENIRGRKRTRASNINASTDTGNEDNEEYKMDEEPPADRTFSKPRSFSSSSRKEEKPVTMQEAKRSRSKSALATRVRSQSAVRGTKEGSVGRHQLKQVEKSKKSMEVGIVHYARGGEADRRHYPKLVKHMNSGKRSLGTSTIGR